MSQHTLDRHADRPVLAEAAPTLKSAVVRRLEEEIVSGTLLPGTRLDEVQLSERYGLSRTPLREALAQVAASGLIEIRPRVGAFVTQMSPRSILECLAFTAEVEGIAATWAAVRMTGAERDKLLALQQAADVSVQAGDADAYFEHNRQFHEAIYAGAHNPYVQESAHMLFLRAAPYRRLQLRQRGRLATSHAEHAAITAAILAEDSVAAAAAVRSHIVIQGDRFLEFLAALPEAYART
jgi:DNA-binding GntR family transcriptional regulator